MNMVLKSEYVFLSPAMELKNSIHKNTLSGFFSAMILLVLISLAILLIPKAAIPMPETSKKDNGQIEVIWGPDIMLQNERPKVTLIGKGSKNIYDGIKEIAGDIQVVSDDTPISKLTDFAPVDRIGIALSTQGEGIRKISNSQFFEFKQIEKKIVPIEIIEDENLIVADIYPSCNLKELQQNVKYPEIARKIGAEGKVIIRVVIDANGAILSTKIIKSDNEIFNNSALEAIKKTSFTPAVQNGMNIKCQVNIPIVFRLK